MLAVLLDEGLPLRAAAWLRQNGIDAVHAREVGLASASDIEILAAARAGERVCFTLDHDFHAILAESSATTPSVVLIRIQKFDYVEAGRLIARILESLSQQLEDGAAVTVTRRGVRLRALPLK
jgi:predicted nuclease of predicted toxin-antitoxin system